MYYSSDYLFRELISKDDKEIYDINLTTGAPVRSSYSISSKLSLARQIHKRYLNIIMENLINGDAVVLKKGVNFYVKDIPYKESPYKDVKEEIISNNKMPIIILNTGKKFTINKDFLVIPSKKIKDKLLKRMGSRGFFTKIMKWASF